MSMEDFAFKSAYVALGSMAIPLLPFALAAGAILLPFAVVGAVGGGLYYGGDKLVKHFKRKKRHEEYFELRKDQYIYTGQIMDNSWTPSYKIVEKKLSESQDGKFTSSTPRMFICNRIEPEVISDKKLYGSATEIFAYCKIWQSKPSGYQLYKYDIPLGKWQEISTPVRYANQIPSVLNIDILKTEDDNKLRVRFLTDEELTFINKTREEMAEYYAKSQGKKDNNNLKESYSIDEDQISMRH